MALLDLQKNLATGQKLQLSIHQSALLFGVLHTRIPVLPNLICHEPAFRSVTEAQEQLRSLLLVPLAANHVHLLEPSPDPAVLIQAVGRVDRLGQTRSVHVHRYIMTGTIEVMS